MNEPPDRSIALHRQGNSGTGPRLIHGGAAYFDTLLRHIRRAEHSVRLLVYIFQNDETGLTVANAMTDAVRRGVEVTVLIDAFGSLELPRKFIRTLRRSGVRIRKFSPFLTHRIINIGRMMHIKLAVFDSEHMLIGGMNISDDYSDVGEKAWLDHAVRISDESVGRSLDMFSKDLFSRDLTADRLKSCKLNGDGFRVLIHDWFHQALSISDSYRTMIRNSRKEIVIMSSYFLPGYGFMTALADAAHRGVDIRLIIAGRSDIPFMKAGIRYFYPWLQQNNIHVYEWQSTVLHAKLMLVDGEIATLGSYNLNSLSRFNSLEMNVEVTDEGFVRELHDHLKTIMADSRSTVSMDRYESKWFRRFLHWIVYRFMRISLGLLYLVLRVERRLVRE